jgi:hypothetical protein
MQPPTAKQILDTVSAIYGVPVKDITGPRSLSNIVYARRCAVYYMAKVGNLNNVQIGKALNRCENYASKIRRHFTDWCHYDKWEQQRINDVLTALTGKVAA